MSTTTKILVEDVATQANTMPAHIRAWTDKLRIAIETDWAGRPVLTERDARRVLEEIQRAGLENAQLHRDFELYEADWGRRQRAAGEDAFQSFVAKAVEQQRTSVLSSDYAFMGGLSSIAAPIGGATYTAANDVAAGAREDFEKREPLQTFDQFEKRWKKGRKG